MCFRFARFLNLLFPHPLHCRGRDERQAQTAAGWGSPGHPSRSPEPRLLWRVLHSITKNSLQKLRPTPSSLAFTGPAKFVSTEPEWAEAWPGGGENPGMIQSPPALQPHPVSSWYLQLGKVHSFGGGAWGEGREVRTKGGLSKE